MMIIQPLCGKGAEGWIEPILLQERTQVDVAHLTQIESRQGARRPGREVFGSCAAARASAQLRGNTG